MIHLMPFNLPPVVQTTVRLLLSPLDDLRLLSEISIVSAVTSNSRTLKPNAIVMGGGGNLTLIKSIEYTHKNFSDAKLIVLVSDDDMLPAEWINESIVSGALHIDELGETLLPILHAVMAGAILFSQSVVALSMQQKARQSSPTTTIDSLTIREKQILELMLQGYDNQQISTTLHLGHQTVRNYVSKINDKLPMTDSEKVSLRMRMRLK